MLQPNANRRRGGFTTIELLVVIGIIVLLIGILIPVVTKVRDAARVTGTAAWIQQLSGAIESYYSDFKAYPGPMSNDSVRNETAAIVNVDFVTPWPTEFAASTGDTVDGRFRITMTENLVLGLLGGLRPNPTVAVPPLPPVYDPALVGKGPMSLNPANPKRTNPYLEPQNLSWQQRGNTRTGAFFDEASAANGADDSIIPEFVDTFSDPMPIIYARAKVGANVDGNNKARNPVITQEVGFNGRPGQYDITQFIGYIVPPSGGQAIGVGRRGVRYFSGGAETTAPQYAHGLYEVNLAQGLSSNTDYPFTAFAYFRDPSLSNPNFVPGTGYQRPHVARQKDKFILISAGADRTYGTTDDITNFGAVVP